MYTLESLIPDCVGRYITGSGSGSSGSGSVQLASLINGRTYAKCWQALVYWIVSQYELGNSTNIAPLGVIHRHANSGGSGGSDPSAKGATFHFFKNFLEKHHLKLRSGDAIREDDLSTIRMNLSTLSRLADVEPATFRMALSHLFRRLGEVLQEGQQVLIDFSVGSLIGDKQHVDFLFHQTQEQQEAKQSSDPRLLHKGGRWKRNVSNSGRSLLGDSKALKARYPLEASSSASSRPRVQRAQDEQGNEIWLDEQGNIIDPLHAQQLLLQEESKEQGEGAFRASRGISTNAFQLTRLVDETHPQSAQQQVWRASPASPSSSNQLDALPNSSGAYARKLQGKEPLRNVRMLLGSLSPTHGPSSSSFGPPPLLSPSPPSESKMQPPFPSPSTPSGRKQRFVTSSSSSDVDSISKRMASSSLKLLPSPPMQRPAPLVPASPSSRSSSRPSSAHGQLAPLTESPSAAALTALASPSKRKLGSLSNLPPVLDAFARTQAAPYSSEQFHHSASAKIASFYTPEACAFSIVMPSGKLVHTGYVPFTVDRLELSPDQKLALARHKYKLQKQQAGSHASSLMGASGSNLDDRALSKSLMRYHYYLTEHMDDGPIAPMKEEWVRNGLALLNTNISLMSADQVERLVRGNLAEIKSDYLLSMKQSILDYVLKNESERARLGIFVPPETVPQWGGGDGNMLFQARPPPSWRAPIQKAYRHLSKHLFRNNPAMLALAELWTKYQHLLLVSLPTPEELPISLRAFEARQKEHREQVQQVLMGQWSEEVEFIFTQYAKQEALTEDNSAHFFEAVATVMAEQLRGVVERSAQAYRDFFCQYQDAPVLHFSSEKPPTPNTTIGGGESEEERQYRLRRQQGLSSHGAPIKSLITIVNPTWIPDASTGALGLLGQAAGREVSQASVQQLPSKVSNNPRPIFLQKLLVHKLKDGSLRIDLDTPLVDMENVVSQLFEDMTSALNDMPRVENKIFSVLEDAKYLQLHLEGEAGEAIWQMKRDVDAVFARGAANAALLLSLYDEYAYLLDEERKIASFLKGAHSLPDYREQVLSYRATSFSLAAHTSRLVRTPLILCDCGGVNDLLVNKAHEASTLILSHLAQRNIDRNMILCDQFKQVAATLLKKPMNTRELVELAAYLAQVKKEERGQLVAECESIKQQLSFLYDLQHRVGSELLSHVGASWSWLMRIDSIIAESESLVDSERHKMEGKIEEQRDTLHKQLANYAKTAEAFASFGDIKKQPEYDSAIHELQRLLTKAEEEIEALHVQEGLLGLGQTDFYLLQQTKAVLAPYETLWSLVESWEKRKYAWIKGPVFKLDATVVENEVEEMFRSAFKLSQQLSESAPIVAKVADEVRKGIASFKPHVPLLHILANPGMRDRHWAIVSDIIQFELRPDGHTPLNRVLEMSVEQHLDALSEVSEAASKEHAIEKSVASMKTEWTDMSLSTKPWRDTGTHILLGDSVEEVQTLLDDHVVKTTTMKGSPFAKPFLDDILEWERWLLHTQEMMEVWLKVQAAFCFLQPVFDAEDITRQMPSEGTMFKVVNANWHKLMAEVVKDTKIYAVSSIPHVLGILKEALSLFDTIQSGLNQYLETKRLYFPRFYFLSQSELLEILSETKNPLLVQPHMKKLFEGVHELEFQPNLDITAMHSAEGEVVSLLRSLNPVESKGAVEKWLKEFEGIMRDTVRDSIEKSIKAYTQQPRTEWTEHWPSQVVLAVNQIHWTAGVARAIHKGKGGLHDFLERMNAELQLIVMKVRGQLTSLQRAVLGALVVIDVHARDVVEQLLSNSVTDVNSFDWQSQMRYYWEDNAVKVRMINAQVEYGLEYLGATDRLVITALTDRCYRTLFGALNLNLGGAPEGPAGTGKTETTKDLAKACAIQYCSDGLDYLAMGKFFKGLAASGAWACFDEFNRIDLEVLSVVAQQIQTIQRAKELHQASFMFEGTELTLNPQCAVFITMNPGYAGRSELPDNLKEQFRTVAMMVPDYALIAEILLYSYGFVEAKSLSRKIVAVYKLCSEQLSSQDHYDYGMRTVKSTLSAAQELKQRFPREKENVLVLRAITDVNLPKFLSHDIELFHGILSDLFPGVKPMQPDYGPLLTAIYDNLVRMNLQTEPAFVTKILQLYEMIQVRHGLMIVGLPFSGKSMCYRVLAAALNDLAAKGEMGELPVKLTLINPKSVSSGELYGNFDPVSHEWTDGILAYKFREFATDTTPHRKWLILDGPVDAIWIENMNTVLDDNKKLCLMSGQIIHMTPEMSLIFEVRDLAVASPATVSRCGMVYAEERNLGWRPLMVSWLATLPAGFDEKAKKRVEALFDWLVPPALQFVANECNQYVPSSDSSMVYNLMQLFSSLLVEDPSSGAGPHPFQSPEGVEKLGGSIKVNSLMDCTFLFALVWSIGASVDEDGRQKFDGFLREALSNPLAPLRPKLASASHFPKKGLVHDYVFNREGLRWLHWSDTLSPNYRIPPELTFQEILVPTIDSARHKFLLDLLLRADKPALFVGPTGTSKSAAVLDTLNKLPRETHDNLIIHFSAQTTASQVQGVIGDKLERRRRGVYGPIGGGGKKNFKLVAFIDELNLPAREKYFAQPPIELVRQVLDTGGYWNVSEFQFHTLVDLCMVAAMGPPGGGRNPVTDRLLRHFVSVSLTPFEESTVHLIFSSIMRWHFAKHPKFAPSIPALTESLVSATYDLYQMVTRTLLPTPSKTHYTYNLRDLTRVFQGLCMSTPDAFEQPASFLRLWIHETSRVFGDRLINEQDQHVFVEGLKTIISQKFNTSFDVLMQPVEEAAKQAEKQTAGKKGEEVASSTPATLSSIDKLRSLFFGSYLSRPTGVSTSNPYVEITDMAALYNVWVGYLEDFNVTSPKPMNLVLFRFAIEHLSRIARILKQPGGHALLVGLGGSGRTSLTRLAASVLEYEVMSIELTKSFGEEEWRAFLRRVLRKAGGDGKHTVLLMNQTEIKKESFLEDINGLLNSAQVSNLWPADELAETLELTRNVAKREKKNLDGQQSLMNYFISLCRSNLHVVLAMSPVGSSFRDRLRMFPSLINCMSLDWLPSWPSDALTSVARDFLNDVELDAPTRSACVTMCMYFQTEVEAMSVEFFEQLRRQCYVTPTSYLELITMFKTLLGEKRTEIAKLRARYQTGLDKLAQTERAVKTMQVELEEMQPILLRTSQETDAMMKVVSAETDEAQHIRVAVAKEEKAATEKANLAKAIERECAADLSEAMPILEAAIAALDTLTPQEISEIKAMRNPPKGVRLVMEVLCVIKKIPPAKIPDPNGSGKSVLDYWQPAQKYILSDPKLLQSLVQYDKDNIDPKVIKKIREYQALPDFAIDKIKAVSKAAHSLASWIYAIEAYDRVVKQVLPKKEALAKAKADFEVVKKGLDAARGELAKVEGKIHALNENLQRMQDEKAELERKMELCSIKLSRAHTLLSGLGGEKTRWTTIAAELGASYVNLTGDILLSAAVIAYLGPFTAAFRASALTRWTQKLQEHGIPCSSSFSLSRTLGDAVAIRKWVIDGLPNDSFSIDNALILSKARRYPLMIDPSGQANRWIKNMERSNQLVVVKATEDYTRAMENAIQFGQPLLMENVGESLDASLDSILNKHIFKRGAVRVIRFGDSDIEWNNGFRLFLSTKLRNPTYAPETQVKVTLLNFMITKEGLSDQLLGIVVAKERPELEQERNKLIVTSAENAARLKEIEDKILQVLASSSGSILDDSSAIEILSASKSVSNEIEEKQKVADETEREINVSRMGYQPVAAHASILFFCCADLANVDPMYQYALTWFTKLFLGAIEGAEYSHVLEERIRNLNDYFSYLLYVNVCRSLFAKDRTLFSLLLAARLQQAKGGINAEAWRFLLTGGLALDRTYPSNPAPSWLAEKSWVEICRLATSGCRPQLSSLHTDVAKDIQAWKQVYDASEPHKVSLPAPYGELDSFSKMLLLRCLRADKVIPAARQFVMEQLGEKFTEAPPFDLASVFHESSTDAPIVFVLSPGSDPMLSLQKFAEERGMASKISSISLGQGQGPIAAKMIEHALKEGGWVVLQNAHLAPSWMGDLERICDAPSMKPGVAHPDFRLWISSYPSPHFPVSILQSAVKLTTESAAGVRQSMLEAYLKDPVSDEKFFVSCRRTQQLKVLTFGLAFFHALLLERRAFGALGFNIPYGFNDSDFRISVRQLHMFLDEAGHMDESVSIDVDPSMGVPFKALQYIIGEVNYGGRVTDDWDRRTLLSLLNKFITPGILQPEYPLSASGSYVVPADGPHQSYLDFIRSSFPLGGVAPEVFGLHENADITKEAAETSTLFTSILLTEAGSSSSREATKNRVLEDLAKDILERLPARFDVASVQAKYPVQYSESMNTVLVQECIRFNRLTDVLRSSLVSLRKALVGEVVMSKELELLSNSMFDGFIPDMWATVSYPSLKPLGSYITDLLARLAFFQQWIEQDVPSIVHLPSIFFTQSFLTALLQNYARKNRVAIDDVAFDFAFFAPEELGDNPTRPESGAYVTGLFLEGARWDFEKKQLAESQPKVLFTPAPIIWLRPCKSEELRGRTDHTFLCPLYRTAARRGTLSTTGHSTNFVMAIRLPTSEDPNHWIQRGCALIASLSD